MAAALTLLLFLPMALIYGRYRARVLRARPGTLRTRLTTLLPMPALLSVCAAIAVIGAREDRAAEAAALAGHQARASMLTTGHVVIDAALQLARWLGELELILFMIAIPFILGAVAAAAMLVLEAAGRLTLPPPSPAGAEAGPGEASREEWIR
ncbi:hypothetical protein [Jiella sp. M17.18]|uniref:hypothetical protein n=1 Tax=Jiella sp. M17.18 TaxID=3234247 RepID=UPI0034E03D44